MVAAMPGFFQLFGKVQPVMDAAVHAHPAQRVIDVGGVAGERHAAFGEGRRDPLVHAVQVPVQQVIGRIVGVAFGEPRLNPLIAQHFFVRCVAEGREKCAPDAFALVARHLDHGAPAFGMGDVVAVAVAGGFFEIVIGGDDDEALFPGEAREIDIQRLADDRPAAVGADEIAPRMGFGRSVGRLHGDLDAVIVLDDARDLAFADQFETVDLLREIPGDLDRLVLFDLQRIGVGQHVGDIAVIELGDDAVRGAVAPLEQRRFDAARQQLFGHPEFIHHHQGRRMQGRCTVIGGDVVQRIEKLHRDACLRQRKGGGHAHRARARDKNTVVSCHSGSCS